MWFRVLSLLCLVAQAALADAPCNERIGKPSIQVSLPGSPFGVVVSNDGCWLFASLPRGGKSPGIAVLSRRGEQIKLVRTVGTQSPPTGIVLTHDGKLLIAAAHDNVIFLDAACMISGCGKPVLGSLSDGRNMESIYVNVTPDDGFLFVSEEAGSAITVIDLTRARATQFSHSAIVGQIPVGRAPIALTFSADNSKLFTTSQAAQAAWRWPAACKPEGRPGVTELLNPEGALVVIDVARAEKDPQHAVDSRTPAGCSPVRMAITPVGDRVYVTARNSNAVLSFDAAKLIADPAHARLGVAPVGAAPVPVAVISDGKFVVAGNSNRFAGGGEAQSLTLLDASKIQGTRDAAIGSIPAGAFPRELCV